jgi:putative colanic acid biosynthesis acetyltransferase WcaF
MPEILQGNDPYTGPSFSLGNRIRRGLWGLAYWILFRPTPGFCRGWRAGVLRAFGAKMAPGAMVRPSARVWAPWNLEMGEHAAVAEGVIVYNMAPVRIGRKATVSQYSHLCAGTHDFESPNFQLYALPIPVGDEAWVCADCFLAPGVTVGEGAVVGARSVVTKDMPPWTVCAGNPCRPIRERKRP